jgi:UDP-N-acetyl-D-glucosamine dehydrogenase
MGYVKIEERNDRMKVRDEKIAVIGLGFVGLPLAIHFAASGFSVIGIDKDVEKINHLTAGKSYIPDVPDQILQSVTQSGLFTAFTLEDGVNYFRQASHCIIAVPTPLSENREPDLGALLAATNYIQSEVVPGQTIIFESSTYPGTLEEVVLPILQHTGKEVGIDFYLGYSPERIDPGNRKYPLRTIPKVVSGQTDTCRRKVIDLYDQVFEKVIPVSSPKVAEMCKLFENTQRLVNISLVNEIFSLSRRLDVDFYEVLQAAGTKPFGYTPYWPGPGIGGHCIPVDPVYLQWKLRQHGLNSRLIQAAQEINEEMPFEIVQRITEIVENQSAKIMLIGMTYKKDVNDLRESPALEIFKLLIQKGYEVSFYDPYFHAISINQTDYHAVMLSKEQIKQAAAVVILTDHSNIDWKLIRNHANAIIDSRGILHMLEKKGSL